MQESTGRISLPSNQKLAKANKRRKRRQQQEPTLTERLDYGFRLLASSYDDDEDAQTSERWLPGQRVIRKFG